MAAVGAGVDRESARALEVVLISVPLVAAFAAAMAAGVGALIALVRGERSLLLAVPALLGLLAVWWVIGEIVTSH
jgi:hypothetical protein